MKKYHGKILHTIEENHPDIKYVEGWTKDKVFTFEDTYTFEDDCTEESIIQFIKRDLMLVAGGGYNTDHIGIVSFEIEKVN